MRRTRTFNLYAFGLSLRTPLINDTCTQILSSLISCTDNYPMLWHNNTGFCSIQSRLSTCTSALFWTSDSTLKTIREVIVFLLQKHCIIYLFRITLCFSHSGRTLRCLLLVESTRVYKCA